MRIQISEQTFHNLEVHKTHYEFERSNSGPVRCRDCKGEIAAGLGIYRHVYNRAGYICFPCFAKDVTILTTGIEGDDSGFFIDTLGRLRACYLSRPSVSTPEVIEAVYKALLDLSYTSIDIILGGEVASPWKVGDAAEAMIGKGRS